MSDGRSNLISMLTVRQKRNVAEKSPLPSKRATSILCSELVPEVALSSGGYSGWGSFMPEAFRYAIKIQDTLTTIGRIGKA